MVADNSRIYSWVHSLRLGFRKLAIITPLACGFFVGSVYAQEAPYFNPATGGYYKTGLEACEAAIPGVQSFYEAGDSKGRTYTITTLGPGGSSACVYSYFRSDGTTSSSTGGSVDGVISRAVLQSACIAGQSKSLTWPAGRYLIPGDESSYQDFGSSAPSTACFAGCNSTRSGFSGDPYHQGGSGVVVQDLPYETDGAACSADGASPQIPDFPPAPEDEEDGGGTGGGDTGGGDEGGGTGDGGMGGNTGGGSGGSTGGGSGTGGGGGTGGGDTGGDTGGGDTGGDTGGNPGGGTGGDTGGNTGGNTGGGGTGGGSGGDDGAGNSAGGLACNQSLTCEGDPVQCAILRTQKAQLCADLDGADFQGHKGEIESLFSGPDFQREADDEITVPSFVTGITRFFPSNTCPADVPITLNSFGGRTFKISYQPICSFAIALGPLIVIAATVFAALYVGRAFGGE